MRWFKHDVDMHTDLKVQTLLERYHGDGYLVWCLCLELLGKEGSKGRLMVDTRWRQGILRVAPWLTEGVLEEILTCLAELRLICSKSFKYGNLYIPTFDKRVDDWTKRKLRSDSVVSSAIDKDTDKDIYIEEKKPLLTYFCGKYQERFNRKYVPSYAKDYSLLKNILGTLSEKEVISLMDKFFATNDPFVLKEGFTIGIFKSQINKLALQKDGIGVWGSELK